MPVETAADRAAFLDAEEFGVEATYAVSGGATGTVAGIFDDPTTFADIGDRASSQDSRPTFYCREADLPAGAAGGNDDTMSLTHPVSLGALTFKVLTIEPDGQGMALLAMAESA